MPLVRLALVITCVAALAACTSVGGGSRTVNVGHGSSAADVPSPPNAAPPVCKPGETLVVLGGAPRCV
jgi:hypothetical protein